MNCKNCDTKIVGISKFCPNCGAKLDFPEPPEQTVTQTAEPVQEQKIRTPSKFTHEYLVTLAFDEIVKLERETHDPKVQERLALVYYYGTSGAPEDISKTYEWFLKAAEQGDAEVQCNAGTFLLDGTEYKFRHSEISLQDVRAKGVEFYQKAANQGYPEAQFELGCLYRIGKVIPEDYQKACEWYQKAANQGYVRAQFSLGEMYLLGNGVSKDDTKAFEWYLKAANGGNPDAIYQVARMYQNGTGVSQDYKKAYEWYQKSKDKRAKEAINYMKKYNLI